MGEQIYYCSAMAIHLEKRSSKGRAKELACCRLRDYLVNLIVTLVVIIVGVERTTTHGDSGVRKPSPYVV